MRAKGTGEELGVRSGEVASAVLVAVGESTVKERVVIPAAVSIAPMVRIEHESALL